MDDLPVFRSSKRRKLVRRQNEQSVDPPSVSGRQDKEKPEAPPTEPRTPSGDDNNNNNSDSGVVRVRKQQRKPLGGVQYSTSRNLAEDLTRPESSLVKGDAESSKLPDIASRFTSSVGQVVNVDQHMVAYIDSKMAERRNMPSSSGMITKAETSDSPLTEPQSLRPHQALHTATTNPSHRQHLSEVDLGDNATASNTLRTQAALERAARGEVPVPEDTKPLRPRKPRISREGKPMKPRPRHRRDSADVARDALVEQVLHEASLGIYEDALNTPPPGEDDASDVDEAMAERFKQEFLDAQAERQVRNQKASQPKMPGLPSDPKGPKLGGSRSARAKMAAKMAEQHSKR